LARLDSHPRLSRLVRLSGVTFAALASIATFGNDAGWELHDQSEDSAPVQLSASAATWTDVFRTSGSGTGARRLQIDGAFELAPSQRPSSPVQVRVRFVPMGATEPTAEEIVYITGPEVFVAVDHNTTCTAGTTCSVEGTLSVEVLDTTALGTETISLHWVATGSLYGRGPAVPADAHIAIIQP